MIVDGTKVGYGHQLLIASMAYRNHNFPIAWTWAQHFRGYGTAKPCEKEFTQSAMVLPSLSKADPHKKLRAHSLLVGLALFQLALCYNSFGRTQPFISTTNTNTFSAKYGRACRIWNSCNSKILNEEYLLRHTNMNIELLINLFSASVTCLGTLCVTIPAVIALIITAQQLRESVKQSKQLENSIKSGIYHDIVGAEREVWQTMLAPDPELLKWWLKTGVGFDDIEDDKVNKQRLFLLHQISFYESVYYQHMTGVLSPEAWQVWKYNMKVDFNSDVYKVVWAKAEHWYMERFQRFVNIELIDNKKKN